MTRHHGSVAAAGKHEPPAAGAHWARQVNSLVRTQLRSAPGAPPARMPADVLGTAGASGLAGDAGAIRFSGAAAESAVRQGLKAPLLAELARAAGIDVQHLYEFAGIDRTTVARRAARDDLLPREASVKAMEFADLSAAAVDVFGTVAAGAAWLTKAHPLLGGETPLQRARTPWGLERVRSLLVALKYGAAA